MLNSLFPRLLRNAGGPPPALPPQPLPPHWPCISLINEEDWEYDARAAAHGCRLLAVAHDVSVRRIGLSTDQLSLGADRNNRKLRDKAYARQAIFRHAEIAGVDIQCADMEHFFSAALVLSSVCSVARYRSS